MPFIDLPDRVPGLRAQARESRPWYRITNQAADEAEVMLYDEVGGWLGATADDFINDLRGITAPNILLRVNSPGGSVTEGIAIANALRSHPANVTVQVDGVAASIASVIAMAGDHVRMMPNALLMVHEASGVCVGEAADMIKMAEVLDKISDNIAGAYAARAGGTEAEWRQVMKNETWYRGEEAVKAGLADEVVQTPKRSDESAEPEMRQQFDLAAYGYAGPRAEPPTAETGLTEDIRSLIGEEVAAQLAAAVAPSAAEPVQPEPVAETEPDGPRCAMCNELASEHEGHFHDLSAEPAPEAPAETEPEDAWAAAVAHLVQPKPDPWAAAVARLINPTSAARSATDAA